MKFPISAVVFFFFPVSLFSQNNLQIFEGSFDSALIQAKTQNKNIFFITRSLSCPIFENFRKKIETDQNTIDFLNNEFVIFEYDMDHESKAEHKRLKKYYHSWRGFPQLYFVTPDEKIITGIVYSTKANHQEQLEIWKNYKHINKKWKALKKQTRKPPVSYEQLMEYISYRDMIYSPFGDININKKVSIYFKGIDTIYYSLKKHWMLFEKYVNLTDLGSDHDLVDVVARNKIAFQKENGEKEVSDYLVDVYYGKIMATKEKKREKLAGQYPYNAVEEAKTALQLYRQSRNTQRLFE